MLACASCPDLQGFAGQRQQLDGSVVDGFSIQSARGRFRNSSDLAEAGCTRRRADIWHAVAHRDARRDVRCSAALSSDLAIAGCTRNCSAQSAQCWAWTSGQGARLGSANLCWLCQRSACSAEGGAELCRSAHSAGQLLQPGNSAFDYNWEIRHPRSDGSAQEGTAAEDACRLQEG